MSGTKARCTEDVDKLRCLLGATALEAMQGSERLREQRVEVQRPRSPLARRQGRRVAATKDIALRHRARVGGHVECRVAKSINFLVCAVVGADLGHALPSLCSHAMGKDEEDADEAADTVPDLPRPSPVAALAVANVAPASADAPPSRSLFVTM